MEFRYKEEENEIIINEYYFNGISPPSNIEFKDINFSKLKITWKNGCANNKNINNINGIKYILEIKEPNKEYQKIYEGNNNYYELINVSLKDIYEIRLCSIFNDLISPWTDAKKFSLSEMNNLKFIHRLNSKNGLQLYNGLGIINDEYIILSNGGIQYGPYYKYELGKYLVIYNGENLLKAEFDVIDNHYKDKFKFKIINKSEKKVYYEVEINLELFSGIEFRALNNTNTSILIQHIDVYKFNN